jgi:methionyl-tRNA synthetase
MEENSFHYAYPQNSIIKSGQANDWKKWWQNDDSRLIHFIGKDNIVFHCIIFPAMLKAAESYILPDNVPANEFLNLEGEKMSTSRKWSVEMEDYFKEFENKEDVLRYVLTAIAPETKDADFSWKDFQTRNNSELVAILGNFINRVMVLSQKYYEGVVPVASHLLEIDNQLIKDIQLFQEEIDHSIRQFKFRDGLFALMNIARAGNKYLAETEPWKLIKTDEQRVTTIMNVALQISCNLAILAEPFLPFTSKKLFDLLNIKSLRWAAASQTSNMAHGHMINKDELLFSKVEDADVQIQLDRLQKSKEDNLASAGPVAFKPETTFDDFSKMDIRTATIVAAEAVPKTDKLLKLTVDTGLDTRTVGSGIAAYFKTEEIIGQKVSLLVNLAPRKIKGIESQGMILMAENAKGELSFVTSTNTDIENGSVIK